MSKIGRKSLGLLLLLVGGIFLAQQLGSFGFNHVFGFIWPIIFVGIVVEIIFYYRLKEPEEKFQFDKGAIVILVLVMVVSASMQNIQHSGIGIVQRVPFINWQDNGISVPYEESYEISDDVEEIHFNLPNARLRIEGTDNDQIELSGMIKANKNRDSELKNLFEKFI